MKSRRHQPASPPGDRNFRAPRKRLATAFCGGTRLTRFVSPLPPGVLVRLFAHKHRLSRPALAGSLAGRRQILPHAIPISRLKYSR